MVVCGLGGRSGLAGRVGVRAGDGDGSRLGTSCSKICCAVRLLPGLSGLGLLAAGPASKLGLRGNSPGAGLLIYCSSAGQKISKSQGSCSLIFLSSSDGADGGDSISISKPASWRSKLALRSSSISSCLLVASVLEGPDRLQVSW